MRNIISLSLPASATRFVEYQTKKRGFPSKSAYLRYLIDLEQDTITEGDVARYVEEALREHRAGKTKKLRSLRDLM
ncbi:MAG: hypothetical protein AAB912_00375 [Patescibacteria group bacterium]